MTLVAIKHINPNEQLKWVAKTSLEKYKKEHIELRWRKNNRMHKRLQKLNFITNMQTCRIKWMKTIRIKNIRTYWIWNEGKENKNLPNITIKRKTITWGDRK